MLKTFTCCNILLCVKCDVTLNSFPKSQLGGIPSSKSTEPVPTRIKPRKHGEIHGCKFTPGAVKLDSVLVNAGKLLQTCKRQNAEKDTRGHIYQTKTTALNRELHAV